MILWIFLPISLSLLSLIGTWTVYSLAVYNKHVCSLSDWSTGSYCINNASAGCCLVPSISASGSKSPESSLFSAVINAVAFLFLVFSMFHHAHILEKNASHSMLSKSALVFGVVAALGAFIAGNCNVGYLPLLHHLGAAVSFICICFYIVLLTALTRKCMLTGFEKYLYLIRIMCAMTQIIVTICYTTMYAVGDYRSRHLSAVFEWILSLNLEFFEFSFVVEFSFFSSWMVSNLLVRGEEEKPLMLTL